MKSSCSSCTLKKKKYFLFLLLFLSFFVSYIRRLFWKLKFSQSFSLTFLLRFHSSARVRVLLRETFFFAYSSRNSLLSFSYLFFFSHFNSSPLFFLFRRELLSAFVLSLHYLRSYDTRCTANGLQITTKNLVGVREKRSFFYFRGETLWECVFC